MRAPFQVLILPFHQTPTGLRVAVCHRADRDVWQFVSGGGEDAETPLQAAFRELWEETGCRAEKLYPLDSIASIRADIYHQSHWDERILVVPEHCFAAPMQPQEIHLSHEHSAAAWLSPDEAAARLTYDSNRTALYELCARLEKGWLL